MSIAMEESLAGVVLAAGTGTRLLPLTRELPKALCPVGNVALIDRALGHLAAIGLRGPRAVAVNAHHHAALLEAHLDGRVHVSLEPHVLGTGGALGHLRPWLDGRAVLLVNADAVHEAPLASVVEGWDASRIRFVVAGPTASNASNLGPRTRLCATLMPPAAVVELPDERCSIYERLWRPWEAAGRTELVAVDTPFFDCGTPGAYLAANLWTSGGASVVGEGAEVHGEVTRSVVWPGAVVHPGERLRDAIRTTAGRTVLVRRL